ncbi:MAG: PLDc N-terminal domain-containing protein [Candidatus Thorarchaeota archaeon]
MSMSLGLMLIFISILVIDLTLMIFCLINISKSTKKSRKSKIGWASIVIILNLIGPLLYLIFGREKFKKSRI